MTRNLVLFFAATFATTTALDLSSTWVVVVQMGYPETNPYSDLSSVEGLVIPEIIALFVGMSVVALGAHFHRRTLIALSNDGYAAFSKGFLSIKNLFLSALIAFPIALSVLRSVAVINNTLIGFTAYGLFVDEEFSLLSRNHFVLFVCAMLLIQPTTYLIYRVCRASTGTEPVGVSRRRPRDQ